jgi:protein-tyrosine phosphatase
MTADIEPPRLADRHLRLAGTRNLRDVGGYPAGPGRQTRWRTLLRTDALDQLPAASQDALIDLGLRCVVDLRWDHELEHRPSVFATSDRVRYASIPLLRDEFVDAGVAATYLHMLDTRAAALAQVVRALLQPGGLPAVIGCAGGIDRTGVTVALLLAAVGVPAEVAAADYALSAESYRLDAAGSGLEDWRSAVVEIDAQPGYMLEALGHLEQRHGGPAALLRREGLTQPELDALRDALTEPVSAT